MAKRHRKFFRNHAGKRESRTFSSKADSDRWAREQQTNKERQRAGLVTEIEPITIRAFAGHWLQSRLAQKKPIGSWQQDETRIRLYILDQFGEREMHTIPTKEYLRFLDETMVRQKFSPATRNRLRSLLSKMYTDARVNGHVLINPITDIKKLPEIQLKWNFLETKAEAEKYLEYAKKESWYFYLFAIISLFTGARVAEVLGLKASDIDFNNRRISYTKILEQATKEVVNRTKGKRNRHVGINPSLMSVLNDLLKTHNRLTKGYLISKDGEAPIAARDIQRSHNRVMEQAGLNKITVHDLRHTFASHFVMNGGSLTSLKEILGHTEFSTTLRYAHLTPGHLEAQAAVVNFALANDSAESNSDMKFDNIIDINRKN